MQVAGHTLLRIKAVSEVTSELPMVQNAKTHTTLMFEFPSEDTLNSVRSLKSSVSQSSSSSSSSSSSAEWFKPQVPMPDMVSAPTTFTSNLQTVDEAKENVIRIFLRILTKAHKSPESSFEQEDAASSALIIVRTLASLSLMAINHLPMASLWDMEGTRLMEE